MTADKQLNSRVRRRTVLNSGAAVAILSLLGCAPQDGNQRSTAPTPRPELPTASAPQSSQPVFPEAALSSAQAVERYTGKPAGEFGLEVPGIQLSLPAGSRAATLTFDACGGANGSGYDAALIQALRTHRVPATLFVNQRWAEQNRSTLAELAADPLFEIANHGTTHAPLASSGQSAYGIQGTGSIAEAYAEIMDNQRYLFEEFGVQCRFFRSGTAHMDELSAALVRELEIIPMNFTVNLDAGATLSAAQVTTALGNVGRGDVGIGHFNQPGGATAAGITAGLPGLRDRLDAQGVQLLRLGDVLTI
ncbi:polysaccharide deacetylase family protein [Glutamicibacter uratoxydans]|uniref:polysaccharide deacetylase family protein n=1 Tax=Glutamicibacter uratoxydans TaxID=43667 RepID=UPI003D6E6A06